MMRDLTNIPCQLQLSGPLSTKTIALILGRCKQLGLCLHKIEFESSHTLLSKARLSLSFSAQVQKESSAFQDLLITLKAMKLTVNAQRF